MMKNITLIALLLAIGINLAGCSSANNPHTEYRPYCIIIENAQAIKWFIEFEGANFDSIWIPTHDDIEGLQQYLKSYLEKNSTIKVRTWLNREYILNNLSEYNLEYSGYVKDGKKFIICNMVYGYIGINRDKSATDEFTYFLDGGCSIVRVIFDAETKSVVSIDCNGQ